MTAETMSPVVEQIRQTIDTRLRELQPVVTEVLQLENLRAALDQPASPEQLANLVTLLNQADGVHAREIESSRDSLPARPRGQDGNGGRGAGADGRAAQGHNKVRILQTVQENPGITTPDMAKRLGIKRTVTSATVNRLKRNGELEDYDGGLRVPAATIAIGG